MPLPQTNLATPYPQPKAPPNYPSGGVVRAGFSPQFFAEPGHHLLWRHDRLCQDGLGALILLCLFSGEALFIHPASVFAVEQRRVWRLDYPR